MNNKNLIVLILTIFVCVLVNSLSSTQIVLARAEKGAHFTKVEYPRSKIYQTNVKEWSFYTDLNVSNANCSEDLLNEAWFFLKVYVNDELWWNEYNDTTHHFWRCSKDSTVQLRYRANIPTWMKPNNYQLKVELYWYHNDTPYLQDTTSFVVSCVLFINLRHQTAFSYLSVYLLASIGLSLYLLGQGDEDALYLRGFTVPC